MLILSIDNVKICRGSSKTIIKIARQILANYPSTKIAIHRKNIAKVIPKFQ